MAQQQATEHTEKSQVHNNITVTPLLYIPNYTYGIPCYIDDKALNTINPPNKEQLSEQSKRIKEGFNRDLGFISLKQTTALYNGDIIIPFEEHINILRNVSDTTETEINRGIEVTFKYQEKEYKKKFTMHFFYRKDQETSVAAMLQAWDDALNPSHDYVSEAITDLIGGTGLDDSGSV